MPTFHDAMALARAQKSRFDAIQRSMKAAHKQMVDSMAEDALDLTSGNVGTKQLADMGHPFSRRMARKTKGGFKARYGGNNGLAKLPINRQTGRLQRSIRIIPQFSGNGQQSFSMQFTAPHARWVLAPGGTKKMLARGFWPEMRKRWRPKNKALIYEIRQRQVQIMKRTA